MSPTTPKHDLHLVNPVAGLDFWSRNHYFLDLMVARDSTRGGNYVNPNATTLIDADFGHKTFPPSHVSSWIYYLYIDVTIMRLILSRLQDNADMANDANAIVSCPCLTTQQSANSWCIDTAKEISTLSWPG